MRTARDRHGVVLCLWRVGPVSRPPPTGPARTVQKVAQRSRPARGTDQAKARALPTVCNSRVPNPEPAHGSDPAPAAPDAPESAIRIGMEIASDRIVCARGD